MQKIKVMINSMLERRVNMRKGMTLIEIIISIALLGIIAFGILPAISAQYSMVHKTKNITVDSFDSQSEVENRVVSKRVELRDGKISPTKNFTVLGVNIKAYDLKVTSAKFGNRTIDIFLSKELAKREKFSSLTANNVRIEVVGGTSNDFANLAKGTPSLEGKVDAITDSTWYTNVYKWYISDPGISEPVFPDDYKQISQYVIPPTQTKITDLNPYANRFIRFSVTPVDKHGVRGSEVFSNNTVLVIGAEWRAGTNAWADKDLDTKFDDSKGDTRIKTEYLLSQFDTQNPLPDFVNPEASVDIKNSALLIPRRIDADSQVVADIDLVGSSSIDWKADDSIHLSTNINSTGESDINLLTRNGSIILYRYIKFDTSGNIEQGTDGKPIDVNDGSKINTQGEVYLTSEGAGNIILQPYSGINLGDNIFIQANGRVLVDSNAFINARTSLTIDTTKNLGILSNRDIQMKNAKIQFEGNPTINKRVDLLSNNKIYLINTELDGKNPSSILNISSKEGNILDNSIIKNFITFIKGPTLMEGGIWDSLSSIKVDDGSILKFEKMDDGNKVKNIGSLNLGNTGSVQFANSMSEDLENPLELTLIGTGNQVTISSNYGRNIGYADTNPETLLTANFQPLGVGNINLDIKAEPSVANLRYSFDGTNKIMLVADELSLGQSAESTITIKDRYAPMITKNIKVLITGGTNGNSYTFQQ